VNYIDDDELAIIKNEKVEFFNIFSGEEVKKRNIEVSWKEEIAEKGDYNHFMIKEIFDQKQSLMSAINHSDEEIAEFISALKSGNGVYMVACGTAHKASATAEYYFSQIAKRKINVVPASEMLAFEHFINKKTILFAVSQSGETADILEVLELGKKRGAKVISITNVESSSVARMSAIVLKKRVVGYGNRVEGSTDIGQKLDYLSKQISAVGGIALVACSLSGEGLLSKGAIFTSLFSSNEPDENLDALFEDLC